MRMQSSWFTASRLSFIVGIIGGCVGLILGILVGLQPLLLCLTIAAIILIICFFTYFKETVLGLLILRSSLDIFSAQQVPAAFAIGLDALTILYVFISLLLKKKIYTDKLWWFLLTWIVCQGLWVGLLPLGGLGRGSDHLMNALEEWVRLFSFVMVYLLIMQLKERIHPETVINWLFFSLIAPLTVAVLQITLPPQILPSFLVFSSTAIEAGSRINGTMGHPNALASFSVLFIGLSLWKLGQVRKRLPWFILIGLLSFVVASTKSLGGLVLITVFALAFFGPRLNFQNLLGLAILLSLVTFFFLNSDFGRERLASLYETPLLNRDLDFSTTLLRAREGGNSFNWRIAQWTYLLHSWKEYMMMGYGLATTRSVSVFRNSAHNDYIAALVEEGIIGLGIFITFITAQYAYLVSIVTRKSHCSTSSQRSLSSILIALLTAISVAMFAANILSQTTLWFYWFTLIAILNWEWSDVKNQ